VAVLRRLWRNGLRKEFEAQEKRVVFVEVKAVFAIV
jgi:hypothetical protein